MSEPFAPDAELLIAPGCPHCPAILAGLADLTKQGLIGELKVINLAVHPTAAGQRGVRSVPWVRIGPFELVGAQTLEELRSWVERAGTDNGRRSYLVEQLSNGELEPVIAVCRRDPSMRLPLIDLASDLETPFAARIGIGAVFEDLGPDGELADLVGLLENKLAMHEEAQVRADAAHFLGLTGNAASLPVLQRLAEDPDAQVREIAEDSLADMKAIAS